MAGPLADAYALASTVKQAEASTPFEVTEKQYSWPGQNPSRGITTTAFALLRKERPRLRALASGLR